MYLDLIDAMREPGKTVRRDFVIEDEKLDDIELASPIAGWVRATNARRLIVIDGKADAEVVLECARCLREYSQPMELELQASIPLHLLRAELDGSAAKNDEDDDIDPDELAALFREHRLDISELARQAIVLQTPPKPLCQDDCPGLPEAAQYVADEADSRLAALAGWNAKNESEYSPNGTPRGETDGEARDDI